MPATRFVLWLLTALACAATAASALDSASPRRPVVLIPGFASSQLVAWRKHSCNLGIQKNLYRNVHVGDRIWIDVARILAQGDCWLRCMKLHMENQTELECKLRAGEGAPAISELDPGLLTGPLSTIWRSLLVDLVEHFHFEPEEIVVATYDWRLPPSRMQQRDKYFSSLKRKIEHAIAMQGDAASGGAVVVAHSMGNNVFRYFLAWLKHEVGLNNWQKWIDTHISAYFAVGAPLLGSSEAMELITSGITQGLPLPQSEVRKLVATFGSILSFVPFPSNPPTSHDSDVLLSVRFPSASGSKKSSQESVETHYTSADIASGRFFREMAVHDPIFAQLETIRKRFYVEDEVLNSFSPWERPPIAAVYAVYGTDLETKYNYRYEDTDVAGHWYQVSLENEAGNRQVCRKTGDGTVPYHSLSWAHTWLGPKGVKVNVTRAPQSVYFSSKQTKTFQAIRNGNKHHADYLHALKKQSLCEETDATATPPSTTASPSFFQGLFGGAKRKVDEITFYESMFHEKDRVVTTSVWELEGARHREILSNSAFLRELRTELRTIFKGLTGADKSARPPVVDSDCYWNYREARCEFPEYCQYRYAFGDVVLDQSCRLRIQPVTPEEMKKLNERTPPLLPDEAHRNSGLTTSHEALQCGDSSSCTNETPLSATLPYEPWDDEDRITRLVPRGMPGYCLVPCEYCRYPTSKRRRYAI